MSKRLWDLKCSGANAVDNELLDDGWEPFAVSDSTVWFKRPHVEKKGPVGFNTQTIFKELDTDG